MWTEAVVGHLQALWADGKSCTIIAFEINRKFKTTFSRNAVIGKIHRLNLPTRVTRTSASRSQRPYQPRVRTRKSKLTKLIAPLQALRLEVVPTGNLADFVIPLDQRKTLLDLTGHTCHWPVGDPQSKDFFFCGGAVDEGTSMPYCKAHFYFGINRKEDRNVTVVQAAA